MRESNASLATSRVFAMVFLAVFSQVVGLGIVLPILPFYVKAMGGSAQTLGWLLACTSIAHFLATPLFAFLSDRWGRRRIVLFSLTGQAISMIVFAFGAKAQVLAILFAANIGSGSNAGNVATCQAAVADVAHGAQRARGMGRVGAGTALGFVLGPIVGGVLSARGRAAPGLGAAAFALAGFLAVALWMPETHPARATAQGRPSMAAAHPARQFLKHHLRDSRVIRLLLIQFLCVAGLAGLQVTGALLGQKRLGWSEREAGYAFALMGAVTMLVQMGLVGRFTRAVGEFGVMRAGSVGMAMGFAGLAVAQSNTSVAVALILLAAGTALVGPVVASTASARAGTGERGSVLGVLQAIGSLARAVGPVSAGFLYTRLSATAPFVFSSAAAIACYGLAVSLASARAR